MGQTLSVSGALTGGGTGALDSLYAGGKAGYYSALATGDVALVYYNDRFYVYRFNIAESAYTESSPTIIKPDNQSSGSAYTGYGAWLLVDAMSADLLSPLRQTEISVTDAVTATIGRMHLCSGTSADYTVTLPAASGNTGKMIGFRMSSALTKLVTLDGNSSETIDGAATRIMWAGETAILMCDGSNWFKIAGKTIPMKCTLYLNATNQLFDADTNTKILLAHSLSSGTNCSLMANTGSNRVDIVRAGNYTIEVCITYNNNNSTAGSSGVLGYINGSIGAGLCSTTYRPASYQSTPFIMMPAALTVGGYVELYGAFSGGSFSTSAIYNNASPFTHLTVTEGPGW